MKKCPKCQTTKQNDEFYKNKSRKDGLTAWCKKCRSFKSKESKQKEIKNSSAKRRRDIRTPEERKARHLKYQYGLTIGEYDRKYQDQNGRCAICGSFGKLQVDHNHETGGIRGLLCFNCNISLGYLKENLDTIQSMKDYIIKYNK